MGRSLPRYRVWRRLSLKVNAKVAQAGNMGQPWATVPAIIHPRAIRHMPLPGAVLLLQNAQDLL